MTGLDIVKEIHEWNNVISINVGSDSRDIANETFSSLLFDIFDERLPTIPIRMYRLIHRRFGRCRGVWKRLIITHCSSSTSCPFDSSAAYEKVAVSMVRSRIEARSDRKRVVLQHRPVRENSSIKGYHDSVTRSAWAVECQPLRLLFVANYYCAISRQLFRNVRCGVHIADDAPSKYREPLPPSNFLHAGHVCSKNGSVIPNPNFSISGSQ
jgi:hypothetical protein